jgi:hypothetical protein
MIFVAPTDANRSDAFIFNRYKWGSQNAAAQRTALKTIVQDDYLRVKGHTKNTEVKHPGILN